MISVLVTGGAGYVGSHVAKALHRAGFMPVVLDNLSVGHRWAVQWGPLAVGDIGDKELVRSMIRQYKIQAVMHFAAHASVGESMEDPGKYFDNNVTRALAMMAAILSSGGPPVIFSSTCATFGTPKVLPICENTWQRPENPYGDSKLFIEKALRWYGEAYGLRSVTLRYFNAAGADPEGHIGECHNPETHLIPAAIEAAMGMRSQLELRGTDYPTPDGTAIRDFVHVCDLASAHVAALRHLLAGGASAACNLGTGTGHSVREVISAVETVTGMHVPVVYRERRPGDPAELVAKRDGAKRLLGWSPQFKELTSIVDTAWKWHRSRMPMSPVRGKGSS